MAQEIFALMGRHRLSQTELAQVLGIGQSSLSRRLNCHQAFDADHLFAIADYFDVPVTDLLAPATLPTDTRSGSSVGRARA